MDNGPAVTDFPGDGVDRLQRGSNQSGVRAYNERLVLSLVRRHGALSKTDIARMTGLSAQTVSVIMRELEADGLLTRGEPIRGKVGQPSVPMSLAPDGAYFFGLKLGRRSADMVLINFLGSVIGHVHLPYRYPAPDEMIRFARESMNGLTKKLPVEKRKRIAGLGIAIPFQLWNWAQTVGAPPGVMDAWRDTDIRAELASVCSFPVYLQNDASAACGAELVFGQAANQRDFLYFYIGYFIGGGVVIKGSLYTGQTGNAGALGSMPVPAPDGKLRQLIDVASIARLEMALEKAGDRSDVLWETPDAWNIDAGILDDWVDSAARGLAHAIVSAASVIDFGSALIDGWMPVSVRKAMVEATRKHLKELDSAGLEALVVAEGTVGYDARALGGASLPLSQRFLVDQDAFLKDG